MNPNWRKYIIQMAWDFLGIYIAEAEEYYAPADRPIAYTATRVEVQIGETRMFAPNDDEWGKLCEPGRNGNWRTKQLIRMALCYLAVNLESVMDEYAYYGENECLAETHVTFNDKSFRMPTEADIEEILCDLNSAAKSFPPIHVPSIGWDVYGPNEDEDFEDNDIKYLNTVFYDASCDSDYVRRSLVNHDGFSPAIIIVS